MIPETHLTSLYLQGNSLNYKIPDEVRSLSKLAKLDIDCRPTGKCPAVKFRNVHARHGMGKDVAECCKLEHDYSFGPSLSDWQEWWIVPYVNGLQDYRSQHQKTRTLSLKSMEAWPPWHHGPNQQRIGY